MAATTYSIRIVFALSSCALHAFILSFSSGTLQTSKIYLPSTKSVVAVGGCNVRRRKVKLKRSKEQKNYSPHGVEKRPSFTFANGGTLGLTLSTAENRHTYTAHWPNSRRRVHGLIMHTSWCELLRGRLAKYDSACHSPQVQKVLPSLRGLNCKAR